MKINQAEPHSVFIPKLVSVLREGYSVKRFLHDLQAGVIVGIIALPLAIAFAIASGVNPAQGLYTAVVAGFVISVLSGSRVQIGGPTGAFIVIVLGIVQTHGYAGLAIATLLAGILLVLMGIARLGSVIQFVPYPITVGFTGGIALIIAASQIPDFLGLQIEKIPSEFIPKIAACIHNLANFNSAALAMALLTIVVVALWPFVTQRIPGSLIAILITTALVQFLHFDVETIGSRFGTIPSHLPGFALPEFDLSQIRVLFQPALTIALLAAIESLLCAVVADGMIGGRHRPNMELIAQGTANIVSPLFLGIPATGAIARTAANVKNGGRTPIAGIVHAATLLLIMSFFGNWVRLIPIATIAGILMVVAYNMSEWRVFVRLFRSPRSDVLVLLTTFLLTVLIDLTVALEVGIILAAFLFMHRMAGISSVGLVKNMLSESEKQSDVDAHAQDKIPEGVEIFEINGPFFFGAARKFQSALGSLHMLPKVLILQMGAVPVIDATGIRALEDMIVRMRKRGTALLLAGVHAQPLVALERYGLLQRVGQENTFADLESALQRARKLLNAASQ